MDIWFLPTLGLCTIWYSHQQYMKFPRSPCPQQYLLLPVGLIIAILVGVKENNGVPVLPPQGVPLEQLDDIQKELRLTVKPWI